MRTPDVNDLARRHGVSVAAVQSVLTSLRATDGRSAQFDHPDLGGRGQWMPGMVQVGDMFHTSLKAKVDALCAELAGAIRAQPPGELQTESPRTLAADAWWPPHLGGSPDAAGGQNDVRYAWFAGPRRLAVAQHGRVTLYDTGEHRIRGVAQQQSSAQPGTFAFSTERGPLDVTSLNVVSQ